MAKKYKAVAEIKIAWWFVYFYKPLFKLVLTIVWFFVPDFEPDMTKFGAAFKAAAKVSRIKVVPVDEV